MAPSDPSVPPPPPPVWASGPGGPPAIRYGGFWLRVVAYIIDAILLNIALGLLTLITGLRLIASRVSGARRARA